MTATAPFVRCLIVLSLGLAVAACARSSLGARGAAEDSIGYYEVPRAGSTYVFGTLASYEAFQSGKPPGKTTRRLSPDGRPVFIQAEDAASAARLAAEYDRRHPMP